jgi:hypothetical protein
LKNKGAAAVDKLDNIDGFHQFENKVLEGSDLKTKGEAR